MTNQLGTIRNQFQEVLKKQFNLGDPFVPLGLKVHFMLPFISNENSDAVKNQFPSYEDVSRVAETKEITVINEGEYMRAN
jgi:hypothetical protein